MHNTYPHPTSMSHLGPEVGTVTSHGTKEVLNFRARHLIFLAFSACSFASSNLILYMHAHACIHVYTYHACAYAYKHNNLIVDCGTCMAEHIPIAATCTMSCPCLYRDPFCCTIFQDHPHPIQFTHINFDNGKHTHTHMKVHIIFYALKNIL